LSESTIDVLAVTVNPLFSVAASVPVFRVTVRAPVAAAGSMLRKAVAVVGEFTVRVTTLIPPPKLA